MPKILSLVTLLMAGFATAAQTGVNKTAYELVNSHSGDELCQRLKIWAVKAHQFTKTPEYAAAFSDLKRMISQDPLLEYTISFGKDSQGSVLVSSANAGNKSNGILPTVLNGFADLHNHPKNTPPSSGDLYGLLMKNRKDSRYDTRYILTAGNVVYALVVTDTVAARNFLANYPPQKTPGYSPLFPDDLLNEYRELLYRHHMPEEMVMAYLLEKYATGTVLLKQPLGSDFTLLRASVTGEGDAKVFVSNNCR